MTKGIRKFDLGDIVYMNSGSPNMTVYGFSDDGKISVLWYNYDMALDPVYSCTSLPPECLFNFTKSLAGDEQETENSNQEPENQTSDTKVERAWERLLDNFQDQNSKDYYYGWLD